MNANDRLMAFSRRNMSIANVRLRLAITGSILFGMNLLPLHAAIFDPGVALKGDMAQSTPTNPFTAANGGGWLFGKASAVTGGTIITLTKTTKVWDASLRGFSDSDDDLPTIQVNTGTVAVVANAGGLLSTGYTIAPGEIALHPDNGNAPYRFAFIRFTVPHAGVYHVLATFRDVSSGGNAETKGIDVHVMINGNDLTNAVVSADVGAPAGSVPSFTADLRSLSLTASDTVDFVVGPNGTVAGAYGSDGTALRASVIEQRPYQASIINLDLNGFKREDTVPGTNTVYTGAAVVGADFDYWNSMAASDTNRASYTIPNLRLSDGLTNSTVRFSIGAVDARPMGGDYNTAASGPNALMNDYVYLSASAGTTATNRLIISGLTPGANYDLFFYSNMRGRFAINDWASDCVNIWFSTNGTKDFAVFTGIAADASGSITGLFYRAVANQDAVFNGLQIVGSFPRQTADIVNVDIDGYQANDGAPGITSTFSGAARIGSAGDYWNSAVILDNTLTNVLASKLRLTDGVTKSTVCFCLSGTGGEKLTADRNSPLPYNALLDDYVYVYTQTNQFILSGLAPNTAYDLYFYCRAGSVFEYGRFLVQDVVYDCIDTCFPINSIGGDCAVCSGIVADGNGSISGLFCSAKATSGGAGVFNGFQLIGPIPRLPLGTLIRVH